VQLIPPLPSHAANTTTRRRGMTRKIALITGCSSGIGRELARQLAAQGWCVYAGARRPETL